MARLGPLAQGLSGGCRPDRLDCEGSLSKLM